MNESVEVGDAKKRVARAPDIRFLVSHPAHLVACGFGSGLVPVAPGTFGTLFAWLSFPGLVYVFSEPALLGFIGVAYLLGIVVCGITGRALGVTDHGAIVWDEIVCFWFVLALVPSGLYWQAVAFLLFRFFDIVKPPPASFFDKKMKNGFGVMADDAVAAGYALLVMAVLVRLVG